MKLSEFIEGVGRPVAYYPRLARVVGGVKQAVLICQLIYWHGKGESKVIHKTAEEIEEETGLTYEEQKVARSYLKKLGVLKDSYARLDHWVNFEIDFDRLNEIWERRGSIGVNPDGEKAAQEIGTRISADGIGANPDRERGKATFANKVSEITSETTAGEGAPAPTRLFEILPEWRPEDQWLKAFLEQRGYPFLCDPAWWDDVSEACGGIEDEFVRREFAKMEAYLREDPKRRPKTVRGWKQFVRKWLCRTDEWNRDAEKKRAAV